MKLFEYLSLTEAGTEVIVLDSEYDIETYFYNDKPDDVWSESMQKLSEKLTVNKINQNGIVVNLSELIEQNITELNESGLFKECSLDSIMDVIESILSGNVSENWMKKFVEILHEERRYEDNIEDSEGEYYVSYSGSTVVWASNGDKACELALDRLSIDEINAYLMNKDGTIDM